LQVPRSQRADLGAGWNYVSDLVGCTVLDQGHEIGRIADVQFGAGEAPLLVVAMGQGESSMCPSPKRIWKASTRRCGEVRMNLPEGMLEINAPLTAEEKQEQQPRKKHKSEKKSFTA
jgi:16S rRNA processing protein RimM